MNQQITAPTSFLSFKKLSSAPTIPKKIVTAPIIIPPLITPSTPSPNDYFPIVLGLGVMYLMFIR